MTRLVLCLGNEWRGDDGAGPEVARALGRRAPAGTRAIPYPGEPSGLIDAWNEEDDVVLVDAVRSGAPAGTVHRLDLRAGPLPPGLAGASTHHLGLSEAVELARVLERLPRRLCLYGIEAAGFDAGAGLGPAVAEAVELVAGEIAGAAPATAGPTTPGTGEDYGCAGARADLESWRVA